MRLVLLGGALGPALVEHLTPDDVLDVVVPITRDSWTSGLKRSPDLDAHLAPPAADDTHAVSARLAGWSFAPRWYRPTDAQVAVQVVRTELLHAGFTLSEATSALAARIDLGYGLHPVSDDRAELHVVVDAPDGRRAVHVDEHLAAPAAGATTVTIVQDGWGVAPAARAALDQADVVVLDAENHALVLGPLLSTPGVVDALAGRPIVIVDGAPDGPLDALAPELRLPSGTRSPADAATVVATARALLG